LARIENCIKSNDVQTAVMIIAKLKQHDMNIVPIDFLSKKKEFLNKVGKVGNNRNKTNQKIYSAAPKYTILHKLKQ
jgi:heterodisulfide reductase subunit C